LGSELTSAINKRGKKTGVKVTQLFPESGVMALNIPQYLSDYCTKKMREDGVEVIPGVFANNIKEDGEKLVLKLSNGKEIKTDHIVVAVGIKPNNDLGIRANLEIDRDNGGIVVNTELSARTDLYVAGDVMSYYDPILGRRRIEHYDQAENSGKHAALNMLGKNKPYYHQPFFWGNMNGIPYEAVGNIDSRLESVGVWQKGEKEDSDEYENKNEFKKGIVYYMKNKKSCWSIIMEFIQSC